MPLITRSISLFALLALTVVVSACGWQLRGSVQAVEGEVSEISADNTALTVRYEERNAELKQVFSRQARARGFELENNADTRITIEREFLDRRPLALTETGVAAQYQLILNITFSVTRNGETALAAQQISSWRSYDFDAKLIAAKAQEEQALLTEMREELVSRMLLAVINAGQ